MLLKNSAALLLFAAGIFSFSGAQAQDAELGPAKPKKFYVGNSLDGAIFSTSIMEKTNAPYELTTLRFTYFFNFGFNFHYDVSKNFGLFTGLGVKNIGFIEKYNNPDSTVKRRVYTLGIPLGLKFGNLDDRFFGFIGGGVDFPFNYKEKGFRDRGDKEKFNEWFSDRTESVMPYVFAGISFAPGIYLKAQYYPTNMMNQSYSETVNGVVTYPYAQYERTELLLLSVGFDIHYNKNPNPPIYMNKKQKDRAMGEM